MAGFLGNLLSSVAGPLLSSLFGSQKGSGLVPHDWVHHECGKCGGHMTGIGLTHPPGATRSGPVDWHTQCIECGHYQPVRLNNWPATLDLAKRHLALNPRLQQHLVNQHGQGILGDLFHFDDSAVKNIPLLNLLV